MKLTDSSVRNARPGQRPNDCLTGEVCIWWYLQRVINDGFLDIDSLEKTMLCHSVSTPGFR